MPDSNEAIGTPKSQYAPPNDGPSMCSNCVHYRFPHLCNHPEVIADAKAGAKPLRIQSKNGLAIISPGGCCRYFR